MVDQHLDDCTCHTGVHYRTSQALKLSAVVFALALMLVTIKALEMAFTGLSKAMDGFGKAVVDVNWLEVLAGIGIGIFGAVLMVAILLWMIGEAGMIASGEKVFFLHAWGRALMQNLGRALIKKDVQKCVVRNPELLHMDEMAIIEQAEHHPTTNITYQSLLAYHEELKKAQVEQGGRKALTMESREFAETVLQLAQAETVQN